MIDQSIDDGWIDRQIDVHLHVPRTFIFVLLWPTFHLLSLPAQATLTKHHRVGRLAQQKLISPSSGGRDI